MKKVIRSKLFIIGISLAVVVGLVLGFALPGFAAGDANPKANAAVSLANNVLGTVTAITATSFDVKNKAGVTETVIVNADTKFYKLNNPVFMAPGMPGMGNKNGQPAPDKSKGFMNKPPAANGPQPNAKFEDLKVNDNVVVHVTVATANNVTTKTAVQVMIVNAMKLPAVENVRGIISAIGADSITIHPAQGADVVVKWDANTHITLQGFISPASGQYAIVMYKTDATTKVNTATIINITAKEPTPPAKGAFPKLAPQAPRPTGKTT
jgi:hypothetical protein